MKTILFTVLLVVGTATNAQITRESALPDHAAKPKVCDELMGQEKEACLKQGGTVKANSAAGGSSAPREQSEPPSRQSSAERTAEPEAKKDYSKPDSK